MMPTSKAALFVCGALLCVPTSAAAQQTPEPGEVHGAEAPGERRMPLIRQERSWQTHLEASVGFSLMERAFDFSDPVVPQNPSSYRSGLVPTLDLGARLYPLASLGGPLANIGLTFDYFRALDLESSMPSQVEPLETTLQGLQVGLQYRWNVHGRPSSPTLTAGLGYGYHEFTVHDEESNPIPLPDITYNYLWIRIIGARVPFIARPARGLRFGATAGFEYLAILDAGEITFNDSGGYGDASVAGLDVRIGLFVGYRWFEAAATFFYRRIWFDFDSTCYGSTGCGLAGGALDEYSGVQLSFSFSR